MYKLEWEKGELPRERQLALETGIANRHIFNSQSVTVFLLVTVFLVSDWIAKSLLVKSNFAQAEIFI